MEPRIVCAAIRSKFGSILTSIRHYDIIMHNEIRKMKYPDEFYDNAEQGFVDQFGKFYTREEAYVVAKENGQIIRDQDIEGELFTEHLY